MALLAALPALHITGMMQASNSELDGGTLLLCALLILSVSPRASFYRLGRRFPGNKSGRDYRDVAHHWPVFLLLLTVGLFYSYVGLNKLVDVGPHWPAVLHPNKSKCFQLINLVLC